MFNFKNSFVALPGVVLFIWVLATSLSTTGRGQVNNPGGPPQFGPRRFYQTNGEYNGSQALAACASGYHMVSLWEIFDTSNLRYDTTLGATSDDSGSGPPSSISGWIRTGASSATGAAAFIPGHANCGTLSGAWTSASSSIRGSAVHLHALWDLTNVTVISPWEPSALSCDHPTRVWCMQD
jgi:hypothetical protein